MASWLTAQLKAAEGLLEAVDKSVSRTVGTLGLAEGDAEQPTPEYGYSRSAANLTQGPPSTGAYQQPYASASAMSNLGAAVTHAPWETRSSAFPGSGPSSGRGLSVGREPSTGGAAAGGFTMKVDAPIPFGGPAAPPAPAVTTAAPRTPADTDSSMAVKAGIAPRPAAAAADTAAPAAARASPAGLPVGPAASPAPTLAAYADGPGPANPLEAGSAGTAAGALPLGSADQWPRAPAAGVASAAPTAPSPTITTCARAADNETQPADAAARRSPGSSSDGGSRSPAAPAPTAASRPSRSPAPGPMPAQSVVSASPAGTHLPTAGASVASGRGGVADPTEASNASAASAAATTPHSASTAQHPAASAGLGSSPPPVAAASASAAIASATSAAASTLASATSAVTHSLSFFNLALDDVDGVADGPAVAAAASASMSAAGGAAAAAAQQIQALSRTCDQLRKRLEASRLENEQLEDMLARAEVRVQQEAALVTSLREELVGLQQARAAAESSMSAQLSVARASLAEVSDKYEASQRSVLVLEGQLAALEESSRRLLAQQNDREGGIVEALRSELAAAESRLAAESKAHQASRAAAAAREMDLEQQIAGSTAALADLTRGLEEANRKCRGMEEELVAATRTRNELAGQVGALQRQLADAGIDAEGSGGGAAGGRAGAAAAAAAAELEVLRAELVQHQRAAQLAKQAAEASQAQAAALTAEVEALRQSAEQHKDTAQLEAQLREVSDMLYLKQTQMERLAAEKAAQQLKTERELESVRQELSKVNRQLVQQGGGRGGDGAGGGGGGGATHDVIPMDALGEPYQRLVRHNNRVGRAVRAAANFLDSTASTTSFVLRQYPLARLVVFAYALLIHLYIYLLIARMQRLATHLEAAVAAPTVG